MLFKNGLETSDSSVLNPSWEPLPKLIRMPLGANPAALKLSGPLDLTLEGPEQAVKSLTLQGTDCRVCLSGVEGIGEMVVRAGARLSVLDESKVGKIRVVGGGKLFVRDSEVEGILQYDADTRSEVVGASMTGETQIFGGKASVKRYNTHFLSTWT